LVMVKEINFHSFLFGTCRRFYFFSEAAKFWIRDEDCKELNVCNVTSTQSGVVESPSQVSISIFEKLHLARIILLVDLHVTFWQGLLIPVLLGYEDFELSKVFKHSHSERSRVVWFYFLSPTLFTTHFH